MQLWKLFTVLRCTRKLQFNQAAVIEVFNKSDNVNVSSVDPCGTIDAGELVRACDDGSRIQNVTAATLAVRQAMHANRILTLNPAGALAVTLPASTGSGAKYRFVVGVALAGSLTIKVANAADFMFGVAVQAGAAGATTAFSTANSGVAGTESDTITLNGSTTGGLKGDIVTIEDTAANFWSINVTGRITGAAATPFSATV